MLNVIYNKVNNFLCGISTQIKLSLQKKSMSVNKNALLRYQVLDKCFRNSGRGYTIDDLLEEVNNVLFEDDPTSSGIQLRQLRVDIANMKKDDLYAAPIETKPSDKGRKQYYYYSDVNFSINNSPLNQTELAQLKAVLNMLNRFEGNPGFEWLSEMGVILKDSFGDNSDSEKVISFESNVDYSGYNYISKIFNSIVNKRVLNIIYHPFNQDVFNLTFHPYYLKQFNNRWFVLGLNQELDIPTYTLALDRIINIKDSESNYKIHSIDWEEYFSEVYGVSKPFEGQEVDVELLFNSEQAPYIKTKPIHQSQKHYELENGFLKVKLKIIPNFELEQLILSFGERVKVIEPKSLKEKIKARVKSSYENY